MFGFFIGVVIVCFSVVSFSSYFLCAVFFLFSFGGRLFAFLCCLGCGFMRLLWGLRCRFSMVLRTRLRLFLSRDYMFFAFVPWCFSAG